MWDIDTIWFDIALVSFIVALGHIFFGLFEERTPRFRKFIKFILTLIVCVALNLLFGRLVMLALLGVFAILAFYIHAVYLPKKGINGWTSEPKKRYYELRGWDTDIFKDKSQSS